MLHPFSFLASVPAVLALMIPIIAIVMSIGAGIVKMMTKHQKEMAELVHRPRQDEALLNEIRSMRYELTELRDRVNQQVIDRDAASNLDQNLLQTPPPPPSDIVDRLNQRG